MKTPMVSIVLPTFNGARYLAEAIESCMAQTFDRWELIIVDDASTDRTPEIVADFVARDRRIRAVRHPVNLRLPTALNTGFLEARGRYFTWISDDNSFRAHALEEMIASLERAPSVDIVYARYSLIDQDGEVLGPGPVTRPEELPFRNVVGPCFLHKRTVYERLGGYTTDLFLAEDYDFWLRASIEHRLACVERDLYLYRIHGGSLSASRTREIARVREECLARSLPRMRWMSREASRVAYSDLISLAVRRGDRHAARRRLWQALGRHPSVALRQPFETYVLALVPRFADGIRLWMERWFWNQQVRRATMDIARSVPRGGRVALFDETTLGHVILPNRVLVPFPEKDGVYSGLPGDGQAAIAELERMQKRGISWFVMAWPIFWFLDEYPEFRRHLHRYACRATSKRVVVFDLRGPGGP